MIKRWIIIWGTKNSSSILSLIKPPLVTFIFKSV